MKHWVVGSLVGGMLLIGGCPPEKACDGGEVRADGTCVDDKGGDAGAQGDGDGSSSEDAGRPDAGSGGGSTEADSGMMAEIPQAPYCSERTPLTDEDKYGLACDTANPGATCGSLECSFGYCNKDCTVGDACSCPGGFVCTSFGGPTACMPSWGWPCTADSDCRKEAPVCVEAEGQCTSECDPNDVKTCPDTWECVSTSDGNLCQRKK